MGTLSLRLPESIHARLAALAEKEGISINQLIASAVAEKLSALMTEDYLSARAARATKARFGAVLAKIPNAVPVEGDELPPSPRRKPTKQVRQRAASR